ncbi:MAG TPA: RNA-directed DNA polymerase [Methylobacter sp.]|jgi:hypothetical protein
MPHKDRLCALISKGYFPKELPTVFTTDDFGKHVNDILIEWKKFGVFSRKSAGKVPNKKFHKRDSYIYSVDHAEMETISKPKRGYERRNIHIIHPIPQALLSYEMAVNWKSVQKWLLRQTYSLDQIRISRSYKRSIKGINFQIHDVKKHYIESISDWLVKTDISRFYPTIYTHSISWAAYGKERVKNNIKLYQGSLADRIDVLVRSCNRNQTIGIPIGPETSRIIAEVISSRIDSDFQSKLPDVKKEHIDRLQDDWFIGVETLEKAENALSAIASVYRGYGLEINGSKTSVRRAIELSGSHWVHEIGAFLAHRSGPIRGVRLRELISLSLRLQILHPSDPVVSYTLSIIETQQTPTEDIETLESFLLKAATISPISMDRICSIILNIQYKTSKLSINRICERFTILAERNIENGNLYEAIWLIYTLRGLRYPLRSKYISETIETVSSSALALILLDMNSKGLCAFRLPDVEWTRRITGDSVKSDWIWLLGYEGIRHGWLADPHNVMAEPFFRAMASRHVAFYDPKKNVPSSRKIVELRKRSHRSYALEAQKLLQELREIKFVDY